MARREQRQIPTVERVASALGAVIVLATLAILGFEALRSDTEEPALAVSVIEVRETNGAFVVDVEVRNGSRSAAADVHLAGTDRAADGQQIQAQARLDYVPGLSTRRASLIFQSNPGQDPPIRVIGYTRP